MAQNAQADSSPQFVDAAQMRALYEQAAASPRKRSHLLLHAGHDDAVQRLIIAAQPGTYVRPHHHSRQWEILMLQSGRMDVLTFDGSGTVRDRIALMPSAPLVQMPVARFHMCIVHEPDTAVLEVKPGPYLPNEFAEWAPAEGHADVDRFIRWAASVEAGGRWQS